jgi:selT/selW/selH-like putative selenoprotein
VSLKNAIEREFDVPIRLRAGAPGSLNVYVNGERVFSKKEAGHSPAAAELIELIRGKIPAR